MKIQERLKLWLTLTVLIYSACHHVGQYWPLLRTLAPILRQDVDSFI